MLGLHGVSILPSRRADKFRMIPSLFGCSTRRAAPWSSQQSLRVTWGILSVNPAAIRHHMSAAITYLFHTIHGHSPGNWPEHTLKIRAHHAFVLGIHKRSIHLVRLSICTDNNVTGMPLPYGRFVFEIDVMRRNKDKRQDQRDHYVVMEA